MLKTTQRGCKQCDAICVFLLNTNANERNHAQTRATGLVENTYMITICLYELNLMELPPLSHNEPDGTFISLANSINLAFFAFCRVLYCNTYTELQNFPGFFLIVHCTVKSFDVWLKMYKCPDRFLKTLWLERPDIPHFTWSLINKECTCLFDISKSTLPRTSCMLVSGCLHTLSEKYQIGLLQKP